MRNYTKEEILEFYFLNWKFERSSGYEGYRNTKTNEWIYADDYKRRVSLKKQYDEDFKLIYAFRKDKLDYGFGTDTKINEFLDDIYFPKES